MIGWHYQLNNMSLSKFQVILQDRDAWCTAVNGVSKNQTWLTDLITRNNQMINNKFWRGCGEKQPLCTVGMNVNWFNHYGKQYEASLKISNRINIWSCKSNYEYLSEGNKNTNLQRYLHLYAHYHIVYDW